MIGTTLPREQATNPWLTVDLVRHGLFTIAATTVFLVAVGSMTRVMEAGLACPDWPLCFGSVLPEQMDEIIFWEWFHRVIATTVGALTLGLTGLVWWGRKNLPRWLPWGMSLALLTVLVQGALGALTVTQFLRFDIVTAHLGTATFFLGLLMTMAMLLQPLANAKTQSVARYIPWVAVGAALLCYGQILLGALLATQWGLHQCLGDDTLCQAMHNHLWGVAPTILGIVALTIAVWFGADRHNPVAYTALGILSLVGVQVGLGMATYLFELSVPLLTVAHTVVGIGLFIGLVVTATLGFRLQAAK